jgi:hypothetical protein
MFCSPNYVSITKGIVTISATMTSNVITITPNSSLANKSDSASGSMNVNSIATTSGDVNPSISGHGMC